jgi:hypothetical protein
MPVSLESSFLGMKLLTRYLLETPPLLTGRRRGVTLLDLTPILNNRKLTRRWLKEKLQYTICHYLKTESILVYQEFRVAE